jgi:hypothetical protein
MFVLLATVVAAVVVVVVVVVELTLRMPARCRSRWWR